MALGIMGRITMLFILLIKFQNVLYSQDEVVEDMLSKDPTPFNYSVKIGAGFPLILGSNEYDKVFSGTYHFLGALDFVLFKNIMIGGYGNYSQFDSGNLRLGTSITKSQITNAGIKIGYEQFLAERYFCSVSADGGYSGIDYKIKHPYTDTISQLKKHTTFGGGLSASFGVLIEGKKAVALNIKYHYINNKFDPADIRRAANKSNKYTQFLTISILFAFGL